jgi:hypothetical protein
MAPAAGQLALKGVQDGIALQASTTDAVAHSVNGASVNLSRPLNSMALELDVTAAAAAVGDTLDVWVQTMIDGTNWVDVVHFTQLLGNGSAKRYFAVVTSTGGQAMFENGSALAAGSIRNILGDVWRIRYTIADGGAHGQSFTFSCWACPY